MALQNFDGMDWYTVFTELTFAGWVATGTGNAIQTTGGRFNGGYLATLAGTMTMPVPTPAAELVCGFAFYTTQSTGNLPIVQFQSASGTECALYWAPATGTLTAYRGAAATSLGTATGTGITQSTWCFIETQLLISDTVGVFKVWVNGVLVINLTGIDTKTTGSLINGYKFGGDSSSAPNRYDDIYILDTSGASPTAPIGDCKVVTVVPTTDAGPNNGTPSTGATHYGVVDEAQWTNGDYTELVNTTGQGEYFSGAPGLASTNTVIGIRVGSFMNKTDAGALSAKLGIKSGSSWSYSSTISGALATSYTLQTFISTLNPATAAAWTYLEANNAVFGVEIV